MVGSATTCYPPRLVSCYHMLPFVTTIETWVLGILGVPRSPCQLRFKLELAVCNACATRSWGRVPSGLLKRIFEDETEKQYADFMQTLCTLYATLTHDDTCIFTKPGGRWRQCEPPWGGAAMWHLPAVSEAGEKWASFCWSNCLVKKNMYIFCMKVLKVR